MSGNSDRDRRVAEVVWPWRLDRAETQEDKRAAMRRNALRESAVMLVVGTVFSVISANCDKLERLRHPGMFVLCLSVLVFVGGMWMPPIYKGIKAIFGFLAKVIGGGIAWILLPPFFYTCFTLGRFVRFLKGKDLLGRKFPTDKETYWEKWNNPEDAESYKRQF